MEIGDSVRNITHSSVRVTLHDVVWGQVIGLVSHKIRNLTYNIISLDVSRSVNTGTWK